MKKLNFTIILTIICLINVTHLIAQTVNSENTDKKTDSKKLTEKDYDEMVAKVNKGDMTVDFHQMRLAYTETKQYSPYGGNSERAAITEALQAKNYEKALNLAEERLKKHFVDLNTIYYAAIASKELNKTEESDFYVKVLRKMIDDILKNGDGLTAKTAIFAIGISEQYFIMSILGFQRASKALTRENGSTFDVHTSTNPETKETRKFYFNIDKVFGRF